MPGHRAFVFVKRSAGRAPAAASPADAMVERSAPAAATRAAGGFFDRREILRLGRDIGGAFAHLGVSGKDRRGSQQSGGG
jgi:hypothetical protein